MNRLLDILYVVLLVLASPWLLYRAVFRNRNRRGWGQKLLGRVPVRIGGKKCIWMHAVSVGEVNLLAPVIGRLKVREPDVEIVISTTTETGFDLALKKYADHSVFFYPLDFSWAIRSAIKRIRPDRIVLAELELWPNMISIAHQLGIPVAVINGRLSESSFRGYKKIDWLLRPAFAKLTCVAAQNDEYAARFIALGTPADRVTTTGSVKFDGLETERENPATRALAKVADIAANDFVFMAGSTQPEEDLIAAEVYRSLVEEFPGLRLVLVPRHPENAAAVSASIERMGLSVVLRSQMLAGEIGKFSCGNDSAVRPVLIVDVIGELSAWWGRADAAYVGGSMGKRGGQNMIEPAAFGAPVSFGPNTRNFRVTVEQLLQADAATVISDADSMARFVRLCLTDPDWAAAMGSRAQAFVRQHVGASDRTVDLLGQLLNRSDRPSLGKAA